VLAGLFLIGKALAGGRVIGFQPADATKTAADGQILPTRRAPATYSSNKGAQS